MPFDTNPSAGATRRPGAREMTALLALLMALNAFAIDAMIPALPDIGADLGVAEENRRQLVVVAYFLGFGSTQLFWGPLADRFGRKPILAVGVALYAAFALLCSVAASFELLIAGRFAMGASAAVTRVLVVAMIRDLFDGEAMARIMSLVFMTFMLVPVLAPLVGQGVLLLFPWRAIFIVLALYGAAMLAWAWLRLPETLHPEYRRPLDWRTMGRGIADTLRERQSLGYTLAMAVSFGTLIAYISSIQQIVFDVFGAPQLIGLVFAAIAAPMALASYTNSRIVERFGLRRVGHSGAAVLVAVTGIHLAVALAGLESLPLFILLQALTMACFSFTSSNVGTLAMEHMAPIAGTASSVQGMIGTLGSAAFGFAIGQAFDGTLIPYLTGIFACSALAFLAIIATEPNRMFAALPVASADPSPMMPDDLC
jgi:DHA1 family bicyclomycin/chloramphenicol resistance-like MFS transporter